MRTRRSFGGFLRVLALVGVVVAVAWFVTNRIDGIGGSPATSSTDEEPSSVSEPGSSVSEPGSSVSEPESEAGPDAAFIIPGDARRAEVRWVHDGDSFDVRFLDRPDAADGDREFDEIRLQGLDTPEPGSCFADQARSSLIDLLKGREVMVHADWDGGRFSDGRDQYFRLIGDVWLDGQLVNVDRVARGYAIARSSSGRFDQAIATAQQSARDEGLGMWAASACGGATIASQSGAEQLTIVSVNADAEGRDDENPNGEWVDIANATSAPIDMTGWTVRDESTRNRFSFPDGFVLSEGTTVRVRSGCGSDTSVELFWCAETPVWTNTADTAYLLQPDGRFHDVLSYQG